MITALLLGLTIARATVLPVRVDAAASAPTGAAQPAPDPSRGCRTPVSERPGETGCYLTVETPLGALPAGPLYWHLYTYPTRAAAEAARGPRGTVVGSFGRSWLYTIAEEGWRPAGGGERVAVIGPLSTATDRPYTARYMEAVFPPGYVTLGGGHRHSGSEAWYVLTGAQCLERPDGLLVARAGESAIVPPGPPMSISGVGPETRRAVLLVLHPTGEPWVSTATDWTPAGRCPK
jgi:quercetin dioxygenase-like cupin family protein